MHGFFLVMGTQRSGTTMLSKALSAHRELYVHNETHLPGLLRGVDGDAELLADRLKEFLRFGATHNTMGKGAQLLGLKDPQWTEHMQEVELAMKFCRALIIIRDPRGVVNSYIHNAWGLGTNVFTGAERWRREVRLQCDLHRRYPDTTMLIRYEDLVAGLEDRLREVCSFLGVEFDPEMLNYHNKDYVQMSPESRHINSRPDSALAERWRSDLSDRQVAIVESLCEHDMCELDLTVEQPPLRVGRLEALYYRAHQAVLGELQLRQQLRRARKRRKLQLNRSTSN